MKIPEVYKRILVIGFVILFGFSLFSLGILFPPNLKSPVQISIQSGQGVNTIANTLKKAGVIRSPNAFKIYSLVSGSSDEIKAGRYVFEGLTTIPEINQILSKGFALSDDIIIFIPEGTNSWDIDNRLVEAGLIAKGDFSARALPFEGYLFPDTYRISRDKSGPALAEDLIFRMKSRFEDVVNPILTDLPNKEEIIIKASMLEKEARRESDMKLVAGIIENRLKIDMLLQIDATVSYGYCKRQGDKSGCDVTQTNLIREIKIDSPFNSYTRKGLPAGPISNPGLQSIYAILKPTPSDYYFYLSTRDGSQMIYSRTDDEHVMNRRRYLGI